MKYKVQKIDKMYVVKERIFFIWFKVRECSKRNCIDPVVIYYRTEESALEAIVKYKREEIHGK